MGRTARRNNIATILVLIILLGSALFVVFREKAISYLTPASATNSIYSLTQTEGDASDLFQEINPFTDGSEVFVHGTREPEAYPYRQWEYEEVDLVAPSAYVFDETAGRLLFEKNSLDRRSIASLTKLLTAVVILEDENIDLDSFVEVTEDAVLVQGRGSSLKAGQSFTIEDLLQMMLVASSNDAAWMLADFAGSFDLESDDEDSIGSYDAVHEFVNKMNAKARYLGLENSKFTGPIGFDSDFHYSTAMDLGILAEYISSFVPEIWEWSAQSVIDVYTKSGSHYKLSNTNGLVNLYPNILGSKTGFTSEAQQSMLVVHQFGLHNVVFIILGSDNREVEMQKLIDWVGDAYLFEQPQI